MHQWPLVPLGGRVPSRETSLFWFPVLLNVTGIWHSEGEKKNEYSLSSEREDLSFSVRIDFYY